MRRTGRRKSANGYGPEVGGRLSVHLDVDMIGLTGSVASGRAVAKAAADPLKRVHQELDGKAPVNVFASARFCGGNP